MQPTISIAIVSAASALIGALGNQYITARANIKAKQLDLSFSRKADAYKDLVFKSGTFAYESKNEAYYKDFLQAYLAVRIVASDNVNKVLLAPDGVHNCAQRLRTAPDYPSKETIKETIWYTSMEALIYAMRDDLHGISKMN